MFKIGDKVRVLKETHGWGCVDEGDIGEVVELNAGDRDGEKCIRVDFPNFRRWIGCLSCFELAQPKPKAKELPNEPTDPWEGWEHWKHQIGAEVAP